MGAGGRGDSIGEKLPQKLTIADSGNRPYCCWSAPYKVRHRTKTKPIKNKITKINLLFLASHVGRNISNPTLGLLVYLWPNKVSGHFPLKINKIMPSMNTNPMQNQTDALTLSNTPAYSIYKITNTNTPHIAV